MAAGTHRRLCGIVLLLLLAQTRAQEVTQTVKAAETKTEAKVEATTTPPSELIEETTFTANLETTTEIPAAADIVPAIATENRNSAFDLSADSESKEEQLGDSESRQNLARCDPDLVGFEIVTGYVFSAPGKLMDSQPGTLMLTDCLNTCLRNKSCQSVNYETGLCVLFSAHADQLPGALTKSQFPVFTIYAQKSCLSVKPCGRAWYVDRVQNYRLKSEVKRSVSVASRRECFELCLSETDFTCRSANYRRDTGTCELSEMDRSTLAGTNAFQPRPGTDYLENHCIDEPNKLCEFKRLPGRILKTVDSVYQEVSSVDECRELCLNSPYRCHSYDYNDTGDMVCRLSHHSRATLSDVQDPYLEVPEASTYELASCYNVTIECGGGDMLARIRTSKLFSGKVYAKGSPRSCAVDVRSALDFELRMNYHDLECNVRQSQAGRYVNDIIIQHHDMIVTSSDLGLALACQYDLTNKSVTNGVNLDVRGDLTPALSEEVIVDSPNVIMRITSRDGSDMMRSAEVGDPLALKFQIMDEQSPYEIFVRELVALDGVDNSEITLIDSNGCPTDHFIMGPIYKSSLSGKVLLSNFDAFKFPSSEVVQFRALVTPCMPSCEPVQCDQEDTSGEYRSLLSYGRKRRSVNATDFLAAPYERRQRREIENALKSGAEEMLLVQSIQITDKFGFEQQQSRKASIGENYEGNETTFTASETGHGFCVNAIGLISAATIFLLTQLAIIGIWTYCYQRRQKLQAYQHSY
ncbi:uncharacterized protein LOC133837434 isoform X1 [Drosophila sulfurigaster albostrigata]|uniref:uncharacterized protein LOC133837434 isoform X1 n=1 Tax=Drosophila sulfurigaster albostrigata TaxID=89887 RepID=UPI002D21C934|nr:uncharacterized protein LOC133837434 isoform X1 [Drosophila sulfurigaster albostrigata]